MKAEAWVQACLSERLGSAVRGSAPAQFQDPLVLHTVTGSVPVANGGAMDSEDATVSVSVVSASNVTAKQVSRQVLETLDEAYTRDAQYAGCSPAFFQVQMLPVRQPATSATDAQHSTQYDAIYRLIFTA